MGMTGLVLFAYGPGVINMSNYSDDDAINAALPLIKEFEGFKSVPYLDIVKVPTIGYGSTEYVDGTKVTLSDPSISQNEALILAEAKIKKVYFPAVKQYCPNLQTANQAAALISFVYNLGIHALEGSTLRKKIIIGDFGGAAQEFLKWDMAGGQEVAGLKRRRMEEQALFLKS